MSATTYKSVIIVPIVTNNLMLNGWSMLDCAVVPVITIGMDCRWSMLDFSWH
jgi:hypothetical protein